MGEGAQLIYAIVFLSGISFLRKIHQQQGIAEGVTFESLFDLELWIREHRARHGVWG